MILYWVAIQLIMIVLKATAIVTWTWWIIFIPSMIMILLQIFIVIISGLALVFVQAVNDVLEDYDTVAEQSSRIENILNDMKK